MVQSQIDDDSPSIAIVHTFYNVMRVWYVSQSETRSITLIRDVCGTVRDTFCSYGVMELCSKGLGTSIAALRTRGVNLACVRTLCVIAEERPRMQLTTAFSKLFSGLGLGPRAVSTSFGCRVNVGICLQVRPTRERR